MYASPNSFETFVMLYLTGLPSKSVISNVDMSPFVITMLPFSTYTASSVYSMNPSTSLERNMSFSPTPIMSGLWSLAAASLPPLNIATNAYSPCSLETVPVMASLTLLVRS